ncbi:hypothetical protein [Gloeocapsa sp. PCC 73106]|uniref:hypothetical protein n=1 Tax=Gloeocapsa sp. PCC 73106 TaxID=102232 RepID=UPI0002E9B61C|nr:hypothetical protein [Gloeocapsa sp. PCC 73106]
MKILQCYHCLYYAYQRHLVCAVHPDGVDGDSCHDFQEDPDKVPTEIFNPFAQVCKFLATNYSRDFAQWLLGKPRDFQVLKPEDISLEPIRTKNLLFLESDDLILHLEFQTNPEPDIPFIIMDYRLRLYQYNPDKLVQQMVIYLTPSDSELVYRDYFSLETTYCKYHIVRLWEISPNQFFQANGLLPLAVLSQETDSIEILKKVNKQIKTVSNEAEKRELFTSTAILANLVLDNEKIQEIIL